MSVITFRSLKKPSEVATFHRLHPDRSVEQNQSASGACRHSQGWVLGTGGGLKPDMTILTGPKRLSSFSDYQHRDSMGTIIFHGWRGGAVTGFHFGSWTIFTFLSIFAVCVTGYSLLLIVFRGELSSWDDIWMGVSKASWGRGQAKSRSVSINSAINSMWWAQALPKGSPGIVLRQMFTLKKPRLFSCHVCNTTCYHHDVCTVSKWLAVKATQCENSEKWTVC